MCRTLGAIISGFAHYSRRLISDSVNTLPLDVYFPLSTNHSPSLPQHSLVLPFTPVNFANRCLSHKPARRPPDHISFICFSAAGLIFCCDDKYFDSVRFCGANDF